ncbi:hypothetical protein LPB144_02225 [Christiangramia salexigens]|uniref:histidine kinase n=1 Tax=Christiangramia salexigens TaxID=1913577 RepID=A0A1L3J2F0_9FLAO|nr:hypothetical protein LPB144_02225 [Christiangramia salexigens]
MVSFNEDACSAASDLFGKNLEIGIEVTDLFKSSDTVHIQENIDKSLMGETDSYTISDSHENKDVQLTFFPVLNKDGEIEFVSIKFDAEGNSGLEYYNNSSNSQGKIDLDYHLQIYENLFHNNPDAVFQFDLEGNFVNANQSSAELAETSREELLNMHFLPLVAPEDADRIIDHFERAKSGKPQNFITGFLSTKGTSKFLNVTNFPIYNGETIIGVFGIAKDITIQKLAENKIAEERQMLRAIIDNIPDYIFVKNRENQSILSNWKFNENILGHKFSEQEAGVTPLDYLEKSKAEGIIADNEAVMKTGTSVINRPDVVTNIHGKKERVLLTKVPLKNQKKDIIGLVGIARDITETYLHNKKQELIFSIIKAFGDSPNFKEAMLATIELLCRELNFDYAEAFKVSVNNQNLIRNAYWPEGNSFSSSEKEYVVYEHGEGLPGIIWESGEFKTFRKSDNKDLLQNMNLCEKSAIKSVVGIPIHYQDDIISIILLASADENKKIESDILKDIAFQIGSAIESKRSQTQLNDFFHYSPNLIAVIGIDGFIKKVNPSFEKKFEYPEEDILTVPFTEFIHPDDLAKTFKALEEVDIAGSDFELRCRKNDGDYLTISWRFSQFFKEEKVVFVYGTDITEIREKEEKLKYSEQRFKALVQDSSDIISIVDEEYNYLYNSPAVTPVFGLSPNEMNATNFWTYIHDEDKVQLVSNLNSLHTKKRIHLPSYRIKNKNGNWRWIETIVTNSSADPAIGGMVMNSRDITEFIIQERKLIESLERYDIVSKATSDLITDYDLEKNKMFLHKNSEQLFGYEPNELGYDGEWWDEKIHPDDIDSVKKLSRKMHDEGVKNLTVEYRFRCADGSYKYILDRSYLLKDKYGAPKRIIASMQDITERKEQLIEIENQNKRLKEIAWTQSHVVRAPLAKIMGLVDLLLNYKEESENMDYILEKILVTSEEMDQIIRKIADQSENEL